MDLLWALGIRGAGVAGNLWNMGFGRPNIGRLKDDMWFPMVSQFPSSFRNSHRSIFWLVVSKIFQMSNYRDDDPNWSEKGL